MCFCTREAEASLHLALHLKLALVALHTTAAVKEGTSFEDMIWADNGSEDFLLSERTSERMWFHVGLTGICSVDLF